MNQPDKNLGDSDPHFDPTVDLSNSEQRESRKVSDPLHETHTFESEPLDRADARVPEKFGRYEVKRLLGRGGFGAVYEGFDAQLGRRVAIKVPRIKSTSDEIVKQFIKEAQRLANLKHPGIVTVHDLGIEDGHCHIVSDFVEGIELSTWLTDNQPAWTESIEVIAKVADALAYAHANSTVHRDIKPANIILAKDLQPVVLDFGLALSEVDRIQRDGAVSGTPQYMSPEQAMGEAHRIDGRTDIFSLGVVLYELLTGRRPFRGGDVQALLRQIIEDDPQPPRQLQRSIPPEVEAICLRAMSKQAEERYTSAGDMADELRSILTSSATDLISTNSTRRKPNKATPDSTASLPPLGSAVAEAEKRQLTLVVCNFEIADGEESVDHLDPEVQHELLNEFNRYCHRFVDAHQGTIIPSSGQEMLICFGYPTAQEDATHRAIRSSLQAQEELAEFNRRLTSENRPAISMWHVIHTGQLVVSTVQDSESAGAISLVGEARNVVARLELHAVPNTVVMSSTTSQLVEGYYVTEPLGTFDVRGTAKPIILHKIVGKSDARSRIDAAQPAGLTPLIGRDTELSILKDRWEQAAEGMGQVVLLIGDAGLGKSRLVHEIKEHVIADGIAMDGSAVVEWRCGENYQLSGLYPATEYFNRHLGFDSADPPSERLDRLSNQLHELGQGDDETVALFASLLSLPLDGRYPALTLTPQRLMDKTHQVIREWLRAFSEQQPIMFIVEDLHWIDPSTLEMLEKLVEEGFHDRMLLVFTFRPEFSTPWTSRAHQTQVALNRLTKRQVGAMMRNRLGLEEVPARLAMQVIERTDGIPLFVEEYAKMISESDYLSEEDGRVELADSFTLEKIPATLQDLLMARLERMASLKEVVQLGATIGREFSWDLLSRASDLDETTLEFELEKLTNAELVFVKGRPPNQTYTFKHALIQDAAYNALLKKRRQHFHRRVAEVLESEYSNVVSSEPELLAHHFSEAGEASKGIQYWLAAGQRSQERFASLEAIDQLRRGLVLIESTEDSPERLGLELQFQIPLTVNLMAAKGYANPEVLEVQRRSRELCEGLGEQSPMFHVLMGMWATNLILEELDRSMQICDDVMELAKHHGDPALLTEAYWIRCCTQLFLGEYEACRTNGELGLKTYDIEASKFHAQFTSQNSGICILVYLALAEWYLGFPEMAQARLKEAIVLDQQLEHLFTRSVLLLHKAYLEQELGQTDAVIATGEQLIEHSTAQGYPFFIAAGHLFKGAGLTMARKYEEAISTLKTANRYFDLTGAQWGLSRLHSSLAEAYLAVGQLEEANDAIEQGFAHVECKNGRYEEPTLALHKASWYVAQSPPDEASAEREIRRAIGIAQRQASKSMELRATTQLAMLLRDQGQRDKARESLAEIYDWFTEGHDSGDLTIAKNLLDELSTN